MLEVKLILKQQDTHSEYETPLSQTPILSLSLERTDPLQREAGSVECKQLIGSLTALSRHQLTRDRVYSITYPIRAPCCDPVNFQACNYKVENFLLSPNPSVHI